MEYLLFKSIIVFSLTLLLTKSKILASKRFFVQSRYESFNINSKPSFIHTWFYKMWTCPMCSGFWISVVIYMFTNPVYGIFDILFLFGVNWIMHCIENVLFFSGKHFEKIEKENNSKQNNV